MMSRVVLRTQSDRRLAALAAAGSEAAFETIVLRYRRALLSYCRRLPLSESHSEDVVQQSLLCAWTALRRDGEIRELRPWLYRITHNQAISALRRPGGDCDELTEALPGTAAPDSDLERRALVRETLAAVAALPELQREAILRTAVDGDSYDEVASALGLSNGAVRGLVHRARNALRAGVAVLAPAPLVLRAADQTRRAGPFFQWLPETLAGGGSAGGAAVVVKGAAVLASSAAVVGGTISAAVTHPVRPVAHVRHRTAVARASAGGAAVRPPSSGPIPVADARPGASPGAHPWAVAAIPVVDRRPGATHWYPVAATAWSAAASPRSPRASGSTATTRASRCTTTARASGSTAAPAARAARESGPSAAPGPAAGAGSPASAAAVTMTTRVADVRRAAAAFTPAPGPRT
jgi:RNA polymerase sigma factor (sigma-70 family)